MQQCVGIRSKWLEKEYKKNAYWKRGREKEKEKKSAKLHLTEILSDVYAKPVVHTKRLKIVPEMYEKLFKRNKLWFFFANDFNIDAT